MAQKLSINCESSILKIDINKVPQINWQRKPNEIVCSNANKSNSESLLDASSASFNTSQTPLKVGNKEFGLNIITPSKTPSKTPGFCFSSFVYFYQDNKICLSFWFYTF